MDIYAWFDEESGVGWGRVGGEHYHISREKLLALVPELRHNMQTRLMRRDATILQFLLLLTNLSYWLFSKVENVKISWMI